MEMPKPQQEHEWLQKIVGEWTVEYEGTMGPDQPSTTWHGTESTRSFGGFWVIGEGCVQAPDCEEGRTIITLGYDPRQKRYIGSFIGAMMANMWVYSGTLDAEERVLTLDTEGPNMMEEGKISRFQDIMTIVDVDYRVLTSQILGDDGEWHQFMTAHYRRVK